MLNMYTMEFLAKFLPFFIYPLGFSLILFLVSLPFAGRSSFGSFGIAISVFILWVPSMPLISSSMMASLERQFPPMKIEDTPKADIAIVLGGGVMGVSPPRAMTEISDVTNHLLYASRLYKAGKIGSIVIVGGSLMRPAEGPMDGEDARSLLMEWGIPAEAITAEEMRPNTFENARKIKDMKRIKPFDSALLITSAYHMPRAVAVFENSGVEIIPASSNVRVLRRAPISILDFVPSVDALRQSTLAIREWIAILVYRYRGYA